MNDITPVGPVSTLIITVCMTCGKYLRTEDGKGVSGLSHGYCEPCARKVMEECMKYQPKV